MIDLARTSRVSRRAADAPEGPRHCSRPGCGGVATAGLSFRYAMRGVYLDLLAAEASPEAYALCTPHADRIRPPIGWDLVDRRPAPPTVAEDAAAVVERAAGLEEAASTSALAGVPRSGPLERDPLVAVLADALRTHRDPGSAAPAEQEAAPRVPEARSGLDVFPGEPAITQDEQQLALVVELRESAHGPMAEQLSDAPEDVASSRDEVQVSSGDVSPVVTPSDVTLAGRSPHLLSPGVVRARFW